jgi:hypothetical protein
MPDSKFEVLLGGWMFYALLGCLAAVAIGAAWWAVGHHSANPTTASRGKTAIGTALLGALLVGGGPVLVGFFTTVGSHIITRNVDRSNGRFVQAQITLDVQTFCSCAWTPAYRGEPIQVQYRVINSGQRPVEAVRITRSGDPAICPIQRLAVDQAVVCTATHRITGADLAAGYYTASATGTGIAADGTELADSASSQAIRTRQ